MEEAKKPENSEESDKFRFKFDRISGDANELRRKLGVLTLDSGVRRNDGKGEFSTSLSTFTRPGMLGCAQPVSLQTTSKIFSSQTIGLHTTVMTINDPFL